VADATGAAVQATLTEQVRAHPNISIFEQHIAVDLIVGDKIGRPGEGCLGAYVLDIASDEVRTFAAPHTVLATGGTGKVYLYTTNPDTATGDGVAMAWRAGCRVANMEFIQFHPTCLYHPQAKSFLISEAVRGEGGLLRRPDGAASCPTMTPAEELAPRDVVARAIDFEMKKHRLGLRLPRHQPQTCRFPQGPFPQHPGPLPGVGHRHHPPADPGRARRALLLRRNRDRSPARTDVAACTPSASRPAPACTAPTGWPAIRSWNAWFSARQRPGTSWKIPATTQPTCPSGTRAG
jgi:hypothetical protein